MQVLDILTGNVNVHTPETSDQVHLRQRQRVSEKLLGDAGTRRSERTGMSTVPSAVSLDSTSLIWLLASVLRALTKQGALARPSSVAEQGERNGSAHISIEICAR